MNSFFDLLLKSNIVFTVLYFTYILLFNKNTFHNLNRILLLSIIVISCILPFISINFNFNEIIYLTQEIPTSKGHSIFNESAPLTVHDRESLFWTKSKVIYLTYLIGVLFIIGRFIFNLVKLFKIKQESKKINDGNFKLIYSKSNSYFSFFNWIFIPEEKKDNTNKSIINHEKLHGIKKHSLDLIISEIFKALIWFNPIVYLFQKSLKTVHEYQVDQAIIKKENLISYLQIILNNLPSNNKVKVYNYFSELTIKKRIKMITKNKTSNWNLLKYTAIIPIVTALLMSFNFKNKNLENTPSILPIKKEEFYKKSSGFGKTTHPILKTEKFHNGIDFIAKIGTEIRATANGTITTATRSKRGYGIMVIIKHNNTFETLYSQMRNYIVSEGEKVKKGQVIGYVGMTGASAGPHLHYEVRKNDKPVNPEGYFSTK